MNQTADLASVFQQLKEIEAAWAPGDLMGLAELRAAFAALTGHSEFALVPRDLSLSLQHLETSVMDLLDDEARESWLRDFQGLAWPVLARETAEPVPAPPEEPEEAYGPDYFSQVISDPALLSQLCDEVKEHLDLAQFSLVDLERDPGNAETVNRVFRSFHTLKSSAAFLGLKNLEEVAHSLEDLLVLVRDGQLPMSSMLTDVIFRGIGVLRDLAGVIEASEFQVEVMVAAFRQFEIRSFIRGIQCILREYRYKKLGEILLEAGLLAPGTVDLILDTQKETGERFGDIAVAQKLVAPRAVEAAVLKQASGPRKSTYVKVLNERLNALVDMVGELVVNQSMLRLSMADPEVHKDSADKAVAQLETVTTGIKDLVLSMGMVSVAEVFNKLRVVIRNTATETGKLVAADFAGEDTELDRNIIETIYDPLVHIVRNAIDHGLEVPEVREAAGKSRVGRMTVRAGYRGNGIELMIEEDGAGIDKERVLAKAVGLGLVTEAQAGAMKEKDVFDLLFLPGFSTREVATEISGRGVGLDVVKQNIDLIHGKVEVDSTLGQGTRFTIRLPLTLAIIDGFVTRVDDTKYVFPFNLIEEIVVPRSDLLRVLEDGSQLVYSRGRHLPVILAGTVFGHRDYASRVQPGLEGKLILLMAVGERRYGVAVDAILGKQEIVIKSLSEALAGLGVFSGGTIFGDGDIGFVVDTEEFILAARKDSDEDTDRG
jgi:two-component system chemotaxis sensor kinase CheA